MEQYLIIDYKNKTITSATGIEIIVKDVNEGGSEQCVGNYDLAESATEALESDLKLLLSGKYF